MSQQLEFPVGKVDTIEFRPKIPAWVVCFEDECVYLECSLVAANLETMYVSCERMLGDTLPDYVVPMERDE